MTVVEVTIVSALLLVVLGIFFGLLVSLTNNERRTQALVTNEQNVRFVMAEMTREIRAANPILPVTPLSAYRDKIELALGPKSAPQTYVRWSYNSTAQTVRRAVLSAPTSSGGTVLSSAVKLRRVRNKDSSVPFLLYYGQSATELVDSGGDPANCAIRVHVTILSDSDPGPLPFREEQDAQVRNRPLGGVGC